MSEDNFWGELIRNLRTDQGISQRVLAERCQVNRSTLRRVEDGRTTADIAMLEKVLKFLGYELDAIQVESRKARLSELARDPSKRSKLAAERLFTMKLM